MGSDKTQIGARVDDNTWERFKSFVERRHGRIRGVLSKEVEDALEAYMSGEYPADRIARIENDVATIKASLAEADGGETIPEPTGEGGGLLSGGRTHTPHTPESNIPSNGTEVDVDEPDDEPGRKAPKADKVEWLFDDLTRSNDSIVVNPKVIEKKISGTWGFGERATNDLLSLLYERFAALPVRHGDGDPWEVALGRTEADREDAIAEWSKGDEYQYVTREKVPDTAAFLHK